MDYFTKDTNKDLSSCQYIKFSVVVDSKGRISLPSVVRKSLGIGISDKLDLFLLTSQSKILIVKNGCDGVIGNTLGCGPDIPRSNRGRGPKKVK